VDPHVHDGRLLHAHIRQAEEEHEKVSIFVGCVAKCNVKYNERPCTVKGPGPLAFYLALN
jgi:hypothetical protein